MAIVTLVVRSRTSFFSLYIYSRGRPNWETQIENNQKKRDKMTRETNAFVDKLKNSKKSALVSLIF